MEKKYIIVRLDDNNYWGLGYWESDIEFKKKRKQKRVTPALLALKLK